MKKSSDIMKSKHNFCCILALTAEYFLWKQDLFFVFPKESSAWIYLALLLVILATLPRKMWKYGMLGYLLLICALWYVNYLKVKLVHFPLTEKDILIAVSNPAGLFDAVGAPRSCQYAAISGFVALLSWLAFRCRVKWRSGVGITASTRILGLRLLFFGVSIALFGSLYTAYGTYVLRNGNSIFSNYRLWMKDGLVEVSRQLAPLGFISYSHAAAQNDSSLLSQYRRRGTIPEAKDAPLSAESFFTETTSPLAPNIVFILAESTFDPNRVFRLAKPVKNSLFDRGNHGLLNVTPFGGGTWMTEFETITGLDSRLFGFLGYYVHALLSPSVKKSFATYLKGKGYTTEAFYPVSGDFYSARTGYRNYGFQKFMDAGDLGLERDWRKFSDERMAERVIAEFPEKSEGPFFDYVVFLENHGPHPCRNFTRESDFETTFAGEAGFRKNCELNEYLLRARSSERGFKRIVKSLEEIENKTGRPFIVAIFGDHQPFSFIDTEFDSYRTNLSKFDTFYSIAASDTVSLPENLNEFHATLLPSIVSTAVAKDPHDVYLPENFYLYEKCGGVPDVAACRELAVLASPYKEYVEQ